MHCIALVSDFFHPNIGGVENHIFQLAQCLLKLSHKVIVITHSYPGKVGLHFLTGNLRVYYLPLVVVYNQCILASIFGTLPLIRWVLLKEKITLVHGHSSFSILAHETMFHARTLGIRTVFTDHSLFGFADMSSIITNKILEWSLADVNCVICVSHTSKENTVLRAKLDPHAVYVIPNAIDSTKFNPPALEVQRKRLKIIVMSRLVYRKGIDLLAGIIPAICSKHANVDFIIGGSGPKQLLLEETVEQYALQERVVFLGMVPHEKVPAILNQGHVFLNTSLTEAFCMAIVEAACCGLQVVSTRVGGVPEVLPEGMMLLAAPKVPDLVAALDQALAIVQVREGSARIDIHRRIAAMYTWQMVAKRTVKVYDAAMLLNPPNIKSRVRKHRECGPVVGRISVVLILINYVLCFFLNFIHPIKHKTRTKNYLEKKDKVS